MPPAFTKKGIAVLKKFFGASALILTVLCVTLVDLEARRCRGNGRAVAAGLVVGAIAGAAVAGSCDVDRYGYYDPYVPPAYRVYYPGAPIFAYDYPTWKYAPIYTYPYDTLYGPGFYRPIY